MSSLDTATIPAPEAWCNYVFPFLSVAVTLAATINKQLDHLKLPAE